MGHDSEGRAAEAKKGGRAFRKMTQSDEFGSPCLEVLGIFVQQSHMRPATANKG